MSVGLVACGSPAAQEVASDTPSPSPTAKASQTLDPPSPTPTPTPTEATVVWEDNAAVSHLFFHSLVVDPARAFDGDDNAAGYLDYMVTVDEFNAILPQLYERDYVLISPHDLYTVDADGLMQETPLELPEGKIPLVLSFDDLSYYEYMDGDGFADRLVIRDQKVVNEYTDADGTKHTGDYDYVSLLDNFVAEHPDFSHNGAKGIVALTGYNGIFGYRTSESEYADTNNRLEHDQRVATRIATAMKDNGWEFASHSWGHLGYTTSGMARIQRDHELWKHEVEPLIGETDLLIYPFGADVAGLEDYAGEKFNYLKGQGFNVFFGIDASTTAWGQLRPNYLRQARINVDGISLKNTVNGRFDTLNEFFDTTEVLDPSRPSSISGTT